MKTILQERVKNYYSNNLVDRFIPMPQALKILAAKAAVDKKKGKLEKISVWNLQKQEVIDETRTSGATVHFALFNGHMSFEKC